MNKDERQCGVVMNCVIRQLVILGNPFYCGLPSALEQEIFPSDLSVSCYDRGTSKFKECPFTVEEAKKGNFFALPCPTRGIHEQMHYYFSK
jgi:hypothetical protein